MPGNQPTPLPDLTIISQFKSLVENGSDLIAVIDINGNYLYVGGNTKSILGYEAEYFQNKNAFDFIHPEDSQSAREKLSAIGDEKIIEFPPFRFLAYDGTWRWIESRLTNLIDDPTIGGIVVNSRDITDRKIYEDQISRLSRIVEETPNVVIITDTQQRIVWVNRSFTTITGYSMEEALGKKPGRLLQGPDSSPDTKAVMRERIAEFKPFEVEILNYTKDKKPYWMNIQCQPQIDSNGLIDGFFAIQTNVTDRKMLQGQLNKEIEQRQKKVTAAIVQAQEKERNEIGKELHDNVNQILSTVKLYLGMVKDHVSDKKDLIEKSTTYIQDCIDEIRHISKRLSGPAQGELNLEEAINDLIQSIAIAARIDFQFHPYNMENAKLQEDVQLAIYRITQEQMTNILRYAEADKVVISLICTPDTIKLGISDNGKGFDVAKKRKGVGISNMYTRAQSVGGRVEIISSPGQGCTLTGTFPM